MIFVKRQAFICEIKETYFPRSTKSLDYEHLTRNQSVHYKSYAQRASPFVLEFSLKTWYVIDLIFGWSDYIQGGSKTYPIFIRHCYLRHKINDFSQSGSFDK